MPKIPEIKSTDKSCPLNNCMGVLAFHILKHCSSKDNVKSPLIDLSLLEIFLRLKKPRLAVTK